MDDWLSIQSYINTREKQKPNPNLENFIAKNGEASYFYALRVLHGPFPKGEGAIAKLPAWAVRYSRFIIKKRFRIAEDSISTDPESCYEYFKHVIKNKLPKKMHNSMILLSYQNPKNYFISKYFQEIENRID